jgi:hypothetical protein
MWICDSCSWQELSSKAYILTKCFTEHLVQFLCQDMLHRLFSSGHIKSSIFSSQYWTTNICYLSKCKVEDFVLVFTYYPFASALAARLWIHSQCYSLFSYACIWRPQIFRSLWFVMINGQFFMTQCPSL